MKNRSKWQVNQSWILFIALLIFSASVLAQTSPIPPTKSVSAPTASATSGKLPTEIKPPDGKASLLATDSIPSGSGTPKSVTGDHYLEEMHQAVAGDFNGDDITDLALCAWHYDENVADGGDYRPEGAVYFFISTNQILGQLGADIFTAKIKTDTVTSDTSIIVTGTEDDAILGTACAAGDFDGDGTDDLLANAPNDSSHTSKPDEFKGTLYITSKPGKSHTSVANAGDVDKDGIDDYLIGDEYSDEVILHYSATGTSVTFEAENEDDYVGTDVAGAGDVDGDGYADVLIGAGSNDDGGENAGAAYLVFGNTTLANNGGNLSSALQITTGMAAKYYLGLSVAGVGDVNGDGFDDIVVGAPNAGYVELILGSSTIQASGAKSILFAGTTASGDAGSSVAAAGDVDGDGYDDFLIGADEENAVYLVLGKKSPSNKFLVPSSSIRKFSGASNALGNTVGGRFFVGDSTNSDKTSYGGKIWILDKNFLPSVNLKDSSKSYVKELE